MSEQNDAFDREISMLRDNRPSLTPLELDRAKTRARRSAGEPSSRVRWQRFASTRGAVVAVLAAGTLMSTGGTAIAVSGLGLSSVASTAQYGGPGTTDNTGTPTGNTGSGPSSAVSPAQAVSPAEQAAQPAVTTSGKLPFTGFMAIPVLLVGLLLIALGLAGRRVARRSSQLPPG